MKYSACIELLFTEVAFPERIAKAKESGFHAVEFWDWKPKDLDGIRRALADTGMELGTFVGNTQGHMIDPQDTDRYVAGVQESIDTARTLGTRHLILTTDILKEDRSVKEPPHPVSEQEKLSAVRNVLRKLKPIAEKAGVVLALEPLNVLVDHKGYYLDKSAPAFRLIREIDSRCIRVLYDIYHMQIMEGNIIQTLRDNIDAIGYIHIADVPGRHEPGTGEINYRNVSRCLKQLDYAGNVGFEFIPTGHTGESLKEAKACFGF